MKLVYEMDYYGEYVVCTADVLFGGLDDYSTAAFNACEALWVDIAAQLNNGLSLNVIKLDAVTKSVSHSGAQSASPLPGSCALRVIKNPLTGRTGSMNFPGIAEASVQANGLLDGAAYSAYVTLLNNALDDFNAADGEMYVGALSNTRAVQSLTPSARIGTFRNRMYGR